MRIFTIALIAATCLASPALANNAKLCKSADIKAKGHVTASQCACMLKNADKYLEREDKAYLLAYWSGKRRDKPAIYFSKAYPSGKNKPLIKYSAANNGLC